MAVLVQEGDPDRPAVLVRRSRRRSTPVLWVGYWAEYSAVVSKANSKASKVSRAHNTDQAAATTVRPSP